MWPHLAVILPVVAVLLAVWILTPPIMVALGVLRIQCAIREDPTRAHPPDGDADYERRTKQFRELGFVPAGISLESAWFLSPFNWYWRTLEGERWWVSPDGLTFVTFNRLIREEPVRFGACTIFDGDAIVRTSCPGAGISTTSGNYRRHEMRKVDPAALLAAHAEHVEAFSRETGRLVKHSSMTEATNAEAEQSRQLLLGKRRGLAETRFQLTFFGLPSVLAFALLPRAVGSLGNRLAAAICIAGLLYVYLRFTVVEKVRKQAALRAHSEDIGRKPEGSS